MVFLDTRHEITGRDKSTGYVMAKAWLLKISLKSLLSALCFQGSLNMKPRSENVFSRESELFDGAKRTDLNSSFERDRST